MSLALRAAVVIALAAVLGVSIGLVIRGRDGGGGSSTAVRAGDLMGQATWAQGERPAPTFTLSDQKGRPISLASARGQIVLVTFLSSDCLRACPREERSLRVALRLLPLSARPTVLVVSLGPGAPPGSAVRRAARNLGIDIAPGWHWLFGSRAELVPVWRSYGVGRAGSRIQPRPLAYLVDERGFERAGFLYPFPPNWLLGDIRTIRSGG